MVGPTNPQAIWEPAPYVRMLPKLFEHLRTKLGDEVELLHDVHERVTLNQGINLCKALEPYRLFFLEDPFPPEDNDHFRLLRQQTSIPIAMGELFNTQHEYLPLIKDRLIDFIRIHISQIGGLSPARKVQALCEYFGVRTAWHGPGDASPLAHAAQLALELASYNFGVHEGGGFPKETAEVFAGAPEVKDGYMLASEKPGLGIDFDEKLAAKFPIPAGPPNFDYSWGTTRRKDGTVIRPEEVEAIAPGAAGTSSRRSARRPSRRSLPLRLGRGRAAVLAHAGRRQGHAEDLPRLLGSRRRGRPAAREADRRRLRPHRRAEDPVDGGRRPRPHRASSRPAA